jgi:hypothetical protein
VPASWPREERGTRVAKPVPENATEVIVGPSADSNDELASSCDPPTGCLPPPRLSSIEAKAVAGWQSVAVIAKVVVAGVPPPTGATLTVI